MATSTEIKIEELCRTCLSKDNNMYSIFDKLNETLTLHIIVTSITGLQIEENDGLPSTICSVCKEVASKAFEFKKKSEESFISLQEILKKENLDWTSIDDSVSDTNSMELKTEDASLHDHEYNDSNFNINLTSGPDLNEIGDLKCEIDGETSKPYYECKKCLLIFKNEHKYQDHQRKKCIGRTRSSAIGVIKGDPCYECKKCLITFETENEYEEHQKKKCIKIECEDSSNTFCPLCGTCFEGEDNLTKHMWKYHADIMGPKKRGRPKKILTSTILDKLSENGYFVSSLKKIECSLCKQCFKTKEELGTHLLDHKDLKMLRCLLCKKSYLDRINFDQHSCIDNRGTSNLDSNNTRKQLNFLSEITLEDLMHLNTNLENVLSLQICSACSCVFIYEKDLLNHHDAEHPELSHRCNMCTKVFATLRSAARHRSICKQVERKYKCSTCGLNFAYEISLNKHILKYHEGQSVSIKFIDTKSKSGDRQFQCDICNRCFYRRDLLVQHTKIHTPGAKCFQCDVCDKKFHRRDNLRSHKRVHEVERDKGSSSTSLCLYCGRNFSNSSNLIVHMRRHTGEKPYKCDFCGKGFPRSSDLQYHIRSHTGEKPCVCRVCGKGFSRSNKLTRHMRVHTGQRPYKCTYCDKAFSQSNDLTLHIRRHTGDRPYICEVCGDRFIQGTALQNHRRVHGHFQQAPPERESLQ